MGVVGAERLLEDDKGTLVKRLGCNGAALGSVEFGQVLSVVPISGWSGASAFSRNSRARL